MKLEDAKPIADNLLEQLKPHCEIINIAGSIRRLCPNVGDIEIVALPKTETIKNGLFGDETIIRSPLFVLTATAIGSYIIKGQATGRYAQIMLPQGIILDLFIPQAHDYYRQLAIRTGSAAYSHRIALSWGRRGWVGTEDGLRLRDDCIQQNDKWICRNPHPILPPVWQSEQEFFDYIKMEYLNPKDRNETRQY